MKLLDISNYAHTKMSDHGLIQQGWTFKFSNAKTQLGYCNATDKTITFSKQYSKIDDDEIIDTILHEIAHALDYIYNKKVSHGETWKKICREIGAKPERLANDVKFTPSKKYTMICEECGEYLGKRHKRGNYTHKKCGGKVLFEVKGTRLL